MSGNFKKEDLRIQKTYKALLNSMLKLLSRQNFAKITVYDLCEEALISRATFYTHFNDKYDLLRYWLMTIKSDFLDNIDKCTKEQLIENINTFIDKNLKMIENILKGLDRELLSILFVFLSPEPFFYKKDKGMRKEINDEFSTLSYFYAGGIINLLLWQVDNNFPIDKQLFTAYLYDLVTNIFKWHFKEGNKK